MDVILLDYMYKRMYPKEDVNSMYKGKKKLNKITCKNLKSITLLLDSNMI
jgi:hypothetical protein